MIEKLTKAQEKKIPVYLQKWLKLVYRTKTVDRKKARKAILEASKGKRVVMVYPIDKWVLRLLDAGAKIKNLGDVRWHSIEDNLRGPGTGRFIASFELDGRAILSGEGDKCDEEHAAAYEEAMKGEEWGD